MIIGRIAIVIVTTLLMLVLFLFSVVFVLIKGPSKNAGELFTLSANETSAMKWLPKLFLSEEEHQAIINPQITPDTFVEFSTAKSISNNTDTFSDSSDAQADSSANYTDEIEVIDIKGPTYKGKLMIVHDPSRVSFASINSFGEVGITLSQFLDRFDAIACTNAGGFEDEGGMGKGGIPDGIVIRDGKIVYGSAGGHYSGFAGFDANHMLHVGNMSGQQALNEGVVNGTSFTGGPVLIKDGVRQTGFISGINPRTCIGQSADGSVLLVAIEGRMADSLGATFENLADLMEEYGAINACNMDGGSSSGMYYEGERITRSCSVVGDRPLPTAIIVTGGGSNE